jgi:hypothetical protein
VTTVPFPTVRWLGIHPNAQVLGTQLLLALLVVALIRISDRRSATR